MTTSLFYIFGSVFLVSIVSLVGLVTLSLRERLLRRIIHLFVALAVGALLGDALIHLVPKAFQELGNSLLVSLAIIGGILLLFVLETHLKWHRGHDHGREDSRREQNAKTLGSMILVSDGMHNFLDGIIIAASYFVSIEVGIATTAAVILHEIPQEIGDFGVLLHAGYTKANALMWNFVSGLFAVLGALIAVLVGGALEGFVSWALPVAAGMFIYVASSDLLPELHEHRGGRHFWGEVIGIMLGVAAMVLLAFFE